MRKIITAATFGLVLGVAGASNPADQSPEARAYLGFNFGGVQTAPRNFHYGLRIDHDSRYVEGRAPALLQFDFTRAGLAAARLNGMNVVSQKYQMRQAEEPAAEEVPVEEAPAEGAPAEEAPAEEAAAEEGAEGAEGAEPQGFFSKTWAGIKGFFSGGDEEEGAAEATPQESADAGATEEPAETADAGATADGPFANYGLVDWGLLALGAVGIGYAVGEVSNAEDSASSGGTDPGTDPDPGVLPDPGIDPGILGSILAGGYRNGAYDFLPSVDNMNPEHQEWLDGGTGHMGDLGVRD
jgi:hypothetical protein